MADLLFIALMIVFFALAVLLVRVCDRIIGADEGVIIGTVEYADDEVEVAA
jgi:hypothetical protein